jgi:uncharacterized YigZ family protein
VDEFKTIKAPTEDLFRDRGSKFIAHAIRVDDQQAASFRLDELWREHPKATHICYAYRLADGYERANDDGEPSGSAGLPILNKIKSAELVNVLVAVIRYYGGTKLGVSGLINAYKSAAEMALNKAKTKVEVPKAIIEIQFPFSTLGEVERIIGQNQLEVVDKQFEADCTWTVSVKEAELVSTQEMFAKLDGLKLIE